MVKMAEDDRERIVALDRKRRGLRAELRGDVAEARHDLHPRTIMGRWTARKKAQVAEFADGTTRAAKKNAPVIGLAAGAILLFAARRPIFELYSRLRDKARHSKDEMI
jgi:hypothetical protein